MASIEFKITFANGAVSSKTASIADADAGRLVAWALATMPTQNDAEGKPIQKSAEWAVGRWIEGTVAETFAKVSAHEKNEAAKAAAEAVQPITVNLT